MEGEVIRAKARARASGPAGPEGEGCSLKGVQGPMLVPNTAAALEVQRLGEENSLLNRRMEQMGAELKVFSAI